MLLLSFYSFSQSNPSPQSLPYSQDFGTAAFSSMPAGTAAWNGISGNATTTQTAAENSTPTGDATVTARTATWSTGGSFGYGPPSPPDACYYVQTSSNTTNGVNQLALALNTMGLVSITVSYSVEMLVVNTRTIGVVMQYRVGNTGAWTTVSGSGNPYSQSGGTTGIKVTPVLTLPAAAENQPTVQLRWALWRGTESGSSSGLGIDDISVTGTPAGPVLNTSVTGLPDFGTVSVGGSSTEQSFTVAGNFLTDTLHVAVSPPFEVSLTPGFGFGNSVYLLPAVGTVPATSIYARFSPTVAGAAADSIVCSSTGANSVAVAVSGTGSICPVPTINPSGTITTCEGTPAVLTSSAGATYLWSNGATTQSISVSTSGSYSVTVSDGSGCTVTSNPVTVVVNSFTYTGQLFSENMGTPSLNPLVNNYTGWQNQGLLTFSSTSSSQSDVRTTTASSGYPGASGSGNVFMGTASSLDRNFIISNINSDGYSGLILKFGMLRTDLSGSLSVDVSSDGISWSPLTITQPATPNSWNYVTASGSIPATPNLSIRFSKPAITTSFRLDDISLTGTADSVVVSNIGSLTICDGTSTTLVSNIPVGNQWAPDPYFTQFIPVYTANTYTVTVTDANGCTATASATTFVIPSPSVTATTTDPGCYGGTDGTGAALGSGGNAPYTYSWNTSPVQSTDTATGLGAGTYVVTVTDANGCTGTTSAVVNETPQLTIDLTVSNVSCYGAGDGQVIANTTTGIGPYSYHWDTVNTDITTTFFTVIVVPKDSTHPYFGIGNGNGFEVNGVQGKELTLIRGITYTFNVNTPGHPFHISTDSTGGSYAGEVTDGVTNSRVMTGTLTFTPNANHPAELYYVCGFHQLMGYHINIIDGPAGATLSNLGPGNYTVTTTDANGCTGSATASVTEPFEVLVSSFAPASGSQGDTVIITGSGFSGVTSVLFNGTASTYTVDNFFQITAIVPTGASTGPVTVVAGGCSGISSGDFTVNSNNVTLNLKAYIEGYYTGTVPPLASALSASGVPAGPADCDTLRVGLYDAGNTSTPVETFTGILQTDGTLSAVFSGAINGNSYYIRLKHRNAIETWSSNPVSITGPVTSYDFTVSDTMAYGNNEVEVTPGVWAMWSGDVYDLNSSTAGLQDGFVESSDYSQMENDSQAFLFGYNASDITGDGIVESADYGLLENNSILFLFAQIP